MSAIRGGHERLFQLSIVLFLIFSLSLLAASLSLHICQGIAVDVGVLLLAGVRLCWLWLGTSNDAIHIYLSCCFDV